MLIFQIFWIKWSNWYRPIITIRAIFRFIYRNNNFCNLAQFRKVPFNKHLLIILAISWIICWLIIFIIIMILIILIHQRVIKKNLLIQLHRSTINYGINIPQTFWRQDLHNTFSIILIHCYLLLHNVVYSFIPIFFFLSMVPLGQNTGYQSSCHQTLLFYIKFLLTSFTIYLIMCISLKNSRLNQMKT